MIKFNQNQKDVLKGIYGLIALCAMIVILAEPPVLVAIILWTIVLVPMIIMFLKMK